MRIIDEFKKMTWKDFLKKCDFSEWFIYGFNCTFENSELYHEVRKYDIEFLLNQKFIKYDSKKHIVVWYIPAIITDWDNNIEFYIVYFWYDKYFDKHKFYKAYRNCFFSMEEVNKYLKGDDE